MSKKKILLIGTIGQGITKSIYEALKGEEEIKVIDNVNENLSDLLLKDKSLQVPIIKIKWPPKNNYKKKNN